MTFLYNIIIFPIIQIIELAYLFSYSVFHNHGFAILGVSVAVSFFTLPVYLIAEKYQENERSLQKQLKPRRDKIKAVFKGDEQYMVLSTFYKQNNYHPIYVIRNSLGFLFQIPFFIAAYSFLSHFEILKGVPFLIIKDLGISDSLFAAGNFNINILPVIMTIINIISGALYSKDLEIKDKIQIYGIALVFLILLYNSPAALVLYWTMNNVFSLAKNVLLKVKNSKKIFLGILIPCIIIIDIFLIFIHRGDSYKRFIAVFLLTAVVFLPILRKIVIENRKYCFNKEKLDIPLSSHLFILSCVILFLLHGIVVPSSLIASSVEEFSFLGSRSSPFPYIFQTLQQSAGIFLFWFIVLYFLFPNKQRRFLCPIIIILSGISIINVFLITENFGFFTNTMTFSDTKEFKIIPGAYILNIVFVTITAGIIFFLLFLRKTKIILSAQIIIIISLLGYSISNLMKIQNDFLVVKIQHNQKDSQSDNYSPQYTFSKTGKNVLVIMLDNVTGSYVPLVFDEKPELISMMQGFHLYPNCSSFSTHTYMGAPGVFGGYDYTPAAINARNKVPIVAKHQEAYLLLPKIFLENNYSITITDLPFDNSDNPEYSLFSIYPEINAVNLNGRYTKQWLNENKYVTSIDVSKILDKKLIRFSFFKSAPLFLRLFIYEGGNWLTLERNSFRTITPSVIDNYAFLDILEKITAFKENGDTYTAIYSQLPHDMAFLQAPDYRPAENITNRGTGPLANDALFHVTTASFLLLGKWFEYLKANGVYDNTRIIIVSDHSHNTREAYPGNMDLPNGDTLQQYNALLMEKNFFSEGNLIQSYEFMTNADVPLLALDGIIDNPVNPFTGIPLQADKSLWIKIPTINTLKSKKHTGYTYNIQENEWLYVKDNIFDPANWKVGAK